MIYLAIRFLSWKWKQTILVIVGLSLGAATIILFSGILKGLQGFMAGQLIDSDAHIRISGRNESITPESVKLAHFGNEPTIVNWERPPSGKRSEAKISHPSTWFTRLDIVPGVASYTPQLIVQGVYRNGPTVEFGKIIGCDPERQRQVTTIEKYMQVGKFTDISLGGKRLIMGDGLAEKLGVHVGDNILLSDGTSPAVTFKLAGLFHFGMRPLDEEVSYALLSDVQQLTRKPGIVTDIAVRLLDPDLAPSMANRWEEESNGKDEVQSWDEVNASYFSLFKFQDLIVNTVIIVLIVVEVFGVYNILSILVTQKRRDIAILKSLGFGKRDIHWLFLSQGIFYGLSASFMGSLIGYIGCKIFSNLKFEAYPTATFPGGYLPVSTDISIFLTGTVVIFGAAILSSLLPALIASKLSPIDIFRSRE